MSSSDFIPYYEKQIKQFDEIAEATKEPIKKKFNEEQSKMLTARLDAIKEEAEKNKGKAA